MPFAENKGFYTANTDSLAKSILEASNINPQSDTVSLEHEINKKKLTEHQKHLLKRLISDLKIGAIQWSDYSATRLTTHLQEKDIGKLQIKNQSEEALLELISRYYYDISANTPLDPSLVNFEYPPLLQIEISSRCNYRCVFCYQTDNTFSAKDSQHMGFMEMAMFKKIIDESVGNIPYITFASRGEPTMHPEFTEMLDYCKGKFLDVKINTNASLLTSNKNEAILDTCDTVVFSIDTPDKKDYPKFRVNGDFERTINNIKEFNESRKRHRRRKKVRTRASGVYYDKSKQDFSKNAEYFAEFVDEVTFVKYYPWEKIYTFDESESSKKCCSQPFYRFFVWQDGSFNCCDMDYKSHLCSDENGRVGVDMSIAEAWNSASMKKIRRLHFDSQRSILFPCSICPVHE